MTDKPPLEIFDRNRDEADMTMSRRVELCYAWAESRGFRVLDEYVAWGGSSQSDVPPELSEAVADCVKEGAGLLIYSLDLITSTVLADVRADLGDLPVYVVTGDQQ